MVLKLIAAIGLIVTTWWLCREHYRVSLIALWTLAVVLAWAYVHGANRNTEPDERTVEA